MFVENKGIFCDYCGGLVCEGGTLQGYLTYHNITNIKDGVDMCPSCQWADLGKVDNFDIIQQHLKFETSDDFYFVQIMQRKKDGCDTKDSSNNYYRVIKSYYIKSLEEFKQRKEKIIELCEDNNARAYININRRSYNNACWEAAETYLRLIKTGDLQKAHRVWNHACGCCKGPDKFWMVDVDSREKGGLHQIIEKIKYCKCEKEDPIIFTIPSKSGYHIVTERFDSKTFNEICPEVDIQKQGIILLYYNGIK